MRLAMRYAGILVVGCVACWVEPSEPPPPPQPPIACGDGIKQVGEQCDEGAANSDTQSGACRTTCRLAGCGDGVLDPGEVCDDGNRIAGDGCAVSCLKIEVCGDGILDPGAEQCDQGVENSDTRPNQCRTNCTLPRCGDGVDDNNEECDDGNLVNGDTCDSNCTQPRCGNGVTGSGEQCDDGNTFNTDACRPDCTRHSCSGGVDSAGSTCFVGRSIAVPDSDLRAVELADLDGNGWADIVVADRDDDTVKVFWNSSGSYTMAALGVRQLFTLTGDRPVDVAIGDIDGNGKLDMVTANENQDRLCVLENIGNRSFKRHFISVEGKPTDVAIVGGSVVVGLESADQVQVIRLSQFTPYGIPQALSASNPESLGGGDVDGDGDADISWSVRAPVIALKESTGFVKASVSNGQASGGAVKLWNLDGAGPVELVTGIYGIFTTDRLRVFVNSDTTNASVFDGYTETPVSKYPVYLAGFGSGMAYADNGGTFGVLRYDQGTLVDERTFTYDGDAKGLASGDLDKDGATDLVIISPDKEAVLIFSGR